MFGGDPATLRHIPRSEYRKRRAYWQFLRDLSQQAVEHGPGGVTIEHTGFKPDSDAEIIE